MKSITIKGSKRESVGKASTKALRNAEKVPCVLYGGGNAIHFSADELSFSKLVYTTKAHTVVIELEDASFNAILQDIQFHPVSDKILHVDFYQLFEDKEISMDIPVEFVGQAPETASRILPDGLVTYWIYGTCNYNGNLIARNELDRDYPFLKESLAL